MCDPWILSPQGSHLGPGTYNFQSSTEEIMTKVTSLRGPYDLFSADRNKPISDGHFAAPVSTFVYSTKSLTLCHCIQYQVPYTVSLYTVPSPLHCVIVYSIKSLTLSLYTVPSPVHCHCIQYQVPYTVIV